MKRGRAAIDGRKTLCIVAIVDVLFGHQTSLAMILLFVREQY
jgi:hypothetical protein